MRPDICILLGGSILQIHLAEEKNMNETTLRRNPAGLKMLGGVKEPVLALITAIIVVGIIILCMGHDPINAYKVLFTSSVTSLHGWGETLQKATLLIFAALSFAIAKKCGMINLGASGQIYMGGIAGMLVATQFAGLASPVHISLTLLAGIAAGAAFGAIVALLKNLFNASEVVTSMMLNYVAEHFCTFLISGPMKGPETDLAQSAPALDSAQLPTLIAGTRFHAGFFIAVAAIVLYWFLMERTTRGYQMKVVGMNPSVGEYAGMKIKTNQLIAMAVAGGLAGLGGAIQATVINVRLTIDWVGNFGFDGLAVAYVGGMNAAGIGVAAILFGILLSGADKMQMLAHVPSSVVYMFQGVVILIIVGRELFEHLNMREMLAKRRAKETNEKALAQEQLIMRNEASDRLKQKHVPTEAEKAASRMKYVEKQLTGAETMYQRLLQEQVARQGTTSSTSESAKIMAALSAKQLEDLAFSMKQMRTELEQLERVAAKEGEMA